jgi:hypothetical protein
MLWVPPTPVIIVPKAQDLVRLGDPRFVIPAMLPGLAGLSGKGGGGGGVSLAPAADVISNKKLVWDARYGVTTSGANITGITDQSGTANNMTGHVGPNDPTWSATGFDGSRPAFTFTAGLPAGVVCSPFTLGTGNTLTICSVAKLASTADVNTNNGRIVSYVASGQANDFGNAASFTLVRTATNDNQMQFARNNVGNNLSGTFTTAFIEIVTVSSSGVITFYLNGTKTVGGSTSSGNWTSGGTFGMGAAALAGNYWAGPFGQIIISTDCIDDTTAGTFYTRAQAEWAL